MESSPPFAPVRPVKPAAPYIGGKRNLARVLVDLIETVPHRTYAEPFVGMGGVFLRRRQRPSAEVINDLSRDVWTFYRVLQEHYPYFMDMLRWRLTSRAEFERLVAVDPATLTDLQRAARFLYMQRVVYGGVVGSSSFGVDPGRSARFNVAKLERDLSELQERLAGVIIECLPWAAFIRRYDTAEALFYLDPPYFGSEGDYGPSMFERSEFEEMAELLGNLQGAFILSLNDHPDIRRIFARFEIRSVSTSYGLARGNRERREVIITR